MKKSLKALLSMIAVCLCLSACGAPASAPEKTAAPEKTERPKPLETTLVTPAPLPDVFPLEFTFSSGAGAWATELTLQKDGSFVGSFHDSNMGENGEGYPNGTVYICDFTGTFKEIQKVNEYTYAMQIGTLSLDREADAEWIEDGVRFVASDPYGLTDGETFFLYTPAAPMEAMDEDFMHWWPGRYDMDKTYETLSCYGLHNTETDDGFFTYLPQ